MLHSIYQLLVNPEGFFRERAKADVRLAVPAAIVLATGLVGAISSYFMIQLTFRLMGPAYATYAGIAIAAGAGSAVIGSLVIWVVIAGVIHGLSGLLGGKGGFSRLLEFVGFGHLPQLIGSVLTLFFVYDFVSTIHVTPLEDQMLIAEAMSQFMRHPSFLMAQAIGIVFLLWSANLWIFGTKYARELNTRNAAISVLAPVGIYIVFLLYNLLNMMGGLA